MLRLSISALASLAVLLSSLVGVAGHEHATEVLRTAASCFVDHDDHDDHDDQGPHSNDGPGLRAAGSEHEHRCHACHVSRERVATAVHPALLGTLAPLGLVGPGPETVACGRQPQSCQARGPPQQRVS